MGEDTIQFVVSLKGGAEAAAQIGKVKTAVNEAGGSIKQFGGVNAATARATGGFTDNIKKMLIQLGLVGLAYKGWSSAKTAITWTKELAENTKKLTSATGLTVEKASGLLTVTEALGVPQQSLTTGFTKLSKEAVKQSEATGKTITAFDKLGISTKFVKEHSGDFNAVLDETLERLRTMPGGIHKNALESELFGRGFAALNPLLGEGVGHLDHLIHVAEKYGAVLKGGNIQQQLEELREAQVESSLATDGLRISFVKLAGPSIVEGLHTFARLKNDIRTGNWTGFDKEMGKIGDIVDHVLKDIEEKSIETFGQEGPRMLKALWRGFSNASLGNKLVIGLAVASKMGLTSAVFDGLGRRVAGAFGRGMEKDGVGMSEVGGKLGLLLGASLIAAVVLLAKSELGHEIEEALGLRKKHEKPIDQALKNPDIISPDFLLHMSKAERDELRHIAHTDKERHYPQVLFHSDASIAKQRAEEGKRSTNAMKTVEAEYNHPRAHGAWGATTTGAGLIEVGERGPELLSLPAAATVAPMAPGSLAMPEGDIVVKIGPNELARINRRAALQSQASGA